MPPPTTIESPPFPSGSRAATAPRPAGAPTALALVAALVAAGAPGPPSRAAEPDPDASSRRPAEPSIAVRFEDVTEEAGIGFRHERAASAEKLYVETMGAGVGWIDHDGDGLLDAFFVNSGPTPNFRPATPPQPALYRNRGDGTFADVTARSGLTVGPGHFFFGVAVADYDDDADEDLYMTGYRRSLLFANRGDGTFENVTDHAGVASAGEWATAAGWFDYDLDGDLDLLVTHYVQYDIERNVVCGDPTPERRAYCHPDSFPGTSPRLYRNAGDGTFDDVTAAAGLVNADGKSLALALADLDGDGWTDVFVANDTQRNFVYFNRGDGTFEDASYLSGAGFSEDGKAEAGMSAAAADVDHDGDVDLYVSHLDAELDRLYLNQGGRLFVDATIAAGLGTGNILNSGFGARFLDADSDGHRDLLVVNGHIMDNIALYHAGVTYAEVKKLYRNLGDARFVDVTETQPEAFLEPRVSRGLAVGDYDNDGFADFLVNNNGQPGQLFRNSGAPGRHWLGVRLIGAASARGSTRDARGARLRVEAGPLVSHAQATGGRSYCSAQDPRILFGLGDAGRVDRLEVAWPGGRRQAVRGLPADRYLQLFEGG